LSSVPIQQGVKWTVNRRTLFSNRGFIKISDRRAYGFSSQPHKWTGMSGPIGGEGPSEGKGHHRRGRAISPSPPMGPDMLPWQILKILQL